MTRKLLIATAASLVLLPGVANAHGSKGHSSLGGHWNKAKTVSTQDFLVAATKLDRFAIATGQLAQAQGGSDAVRALGGTLVQNHTALQQQVDGLAARLGVTLPTGLDPWSQRWVDKLAERSGSEFDWKFVKTQLGVQQKALQGALWAAIRADTPEGRTLAQGALPTLTSHLAALHDLAAVDDDGDHGWSGSRGDDDDDDDRFDRHGSKHGDKRGHSRGRGHDSRHKSRR